jgi:hypothetical protein
MLHLLFIFPLFPTQHHCFSLLLIPLLLSTINFVYIHGTMRIHLNLKTVFSGCCTVSLLFTFYTVNWIPILFRGKIYFYFYVLLIFKLQIRRTAVDLQEVCFTPYNISLHYSPVLPDILLYFLLWKGVPRAIITRDLFYPYFLPLPFYPLSVFPNQVFILYPKCVWAILQNAYAQRSNIFCLLWSSTSSTCETCR